MSTYFLLDPFEFPFYFYRIHQGKHCILETWNRHLIELIFKPVLTLIIETHLKANAIIFNGKDALTQW